MSMACLLSGDSAWQRGANRWGCFYCPSTNEARTTAVICSRTAKMSCSAGVNVVTVLKAPPRGGCAVAQRHALGYTVEIALKQAV